MELTANLPQEVSLCLS